MDGFDQSSNIIVIAATNFPQTLDHALTRPGRFDKHVAVPLPDVRGREQILGLYTSRTILDATANLKALAQGTPGFSGADLSNLVNQVGGLLSAVVCLRACRDTVEAVMSGERGVVWRVRHIHEQSRRGDLCLGEQ